MINVQNASRSRTRSSVATFWRESESLWGSMTFIINLISGPGNGKSTLSYLICFVLKILQFKVELVQEFAKTLVWAEDFETLNNQHFVSQRQYRRMRDIDGKVDFVVTDGCILHGLYYNRYNNDNLSNVSKTEQAILSWYHQFQNINIFLERGDFPYEQVGRIQSHVEALEIDRKLLEILNEYAIPYLTCQSDQRNLEMILDYISRISCTPISHLNAIKLTPD